MLDFVTITFNNNCELNLLKLQAYSFKYVDINIISNIYIVFNDNNFDIFKQSFDNIIAYFPKEIHHKVKLLSLKELNIDYPANSNWFSQQRVKIEIAKYIKNKYYVVLDSKNHFISKIDSTFFFKNEKPILYFNSVGEEMLQYYNNCLNYFKITCPNTTKPKLKIQTTTPFLFITEECISLMNFIKEKERIDFGTFFMREQKYTEFYFYYAFLTCFKKRNLYCYLSHIRQPCLTIGKQNPEVDYYNSWEYKLDILKKKDILVFSIHRNSINAINDTYKMNLIKFYQPIYKDIRIESLLKTILFSN
jgi:hypothetical protein